MLRALTAVALVFALAVPARAATVADETAAQIRKALPPDLALVSLSMTGGDKLASEDLAVVWHGAPRPGPGSVLVNGGPSKVWARIVLASVGEVVVATRPLAAKETIRPGDLVRDSRPLTSGRELALDPDFLAGAQLTRAVAAGAVLGGTDLILPPPIPRGTPVKIVIPIGSGGATVSAHGILERSAHIGERTSVRLEGIARILDGELVDPSTISIQRGNR